MTKQNEIVYEIANACWIEEPYYVNDLVKYVVGSQVLRIAKWKKIKLLLDRQASISQEEECGKLNQM